jgi:hypothetical protein
MHFGLQLGHCRQIGCKLLISLALFDKFLHNQSRMQLTLSGIRPKIFRFQFQDKPL